MLTWSLAALREIEKDDGSYPLSSIEGRHNMTGSDQDYILKHMRARIVEAIDESCKAFAKHMSEAGYSEPPPPRQYFASCVMQSAYCLLCGADVDTFEGGDPEIAWHAIKNAVNISNHYWGSNFELQSA